MRQALTDEELVYWCKLIVENGDAHAFYEKRFP